MALGQGDSRDSIACFMISWISLLASAWVPQLSNTSPWLVAKHQWLIDWFRQASKTNISCEVISKWLIWGFQYQATVSLFSACLGTCLHGQNLSGLQVCGLVGFASSNCFTVWGPTESACTRMEDLLIPNASQSSKLVHVSPSKKSLEDIFTHELDPWYCTLCSLSTKNAGKIYNWWFAVLFTPEIPTICTTPGFPGLISLFSFGRCFVCWFRSWKLKNLQEYNEILQCHVEDRLYNDNNKTKMHYCVVWSFCCKTKIALFMFDNFACSFASKIKVILANVPLKLLCSVAPVYVELTWMINLGLGAVSRSNSSD